MWTDEWKNSGNNLWNSWNEMIIKSKYTYRFTYLFIYLFFIIYFFFKSRLNFSWWQQLLCTLSTVMLAVCLWITIYYALLDVLMCKSNVISLTHEIQSAIFWRWNVARLILFWDMDALKTVSNIQKFVI